MGKPLSYFLGYPFEARTTQQAESVENSTGTSLSVPLVVACITVSRSDLRSGSTTCVSGSPKRQLYSTTFGPSFVSIRPKYRQPLKGRPSAFIARIVGRKIVCMHSSAIFSV